MKKYMITGIALLGMTMLYGQNYISGPVGLYGTAYNPATTIDPSTGSVLVGSGGTWVFGGIVTSSNVAHSIAFSGGATPYSGQSSTQYVSNYVSQVGNTAFAFPVGDQNTTVGTASHSLSISAPSVSTTVTASYVSSQATPNSNNLNIIHTIDVAAFWTMNSPITTNATVTVATRDLSSAFNPGATIFLAGYNKANNYWEQLSNTTALVGGGQNISSNAAVNLGNYSAFTIGSTTYLLPVTLTSFTGIADGCTANLAWQTSNESNSGFYALEASTDGINFGQVAKVASKNSLAGAMYSSSYPLSSSTGFFRLKIVDLDGRYTYSSVTAVTGTGACGTSVQVSVSPNPTKNLLNLQGLDGGKNRVILYDMNGKKMTEILATGTSQRIDISGYAKGIYMMRIENSKGNTITLKVVKQ